MIHAVLTALCFACCGSQDHSDKLVFVQDGEDLVIAMKLEIDSKPYLIWSHPEIIMHHDPHLKGPRNPPKTLSVHLHYEVIQCRIALLPTSPGKMKQQVEVKWRLKNHKRDGETYWTMKGFSPSTQELEELLPKLQKLSSDTKQHNQKLTPRP